MRTAQVMVVHERRGTWARQLRARLRDPGLRWLESRSTADLLAAVRGAPRPIVVYEVGRRAEEGLEGLLRLTLAADDPLVLLLDPESRPDVLALGRELGASVVRAGVVTPPEVEALLRRWLGLVGHRAAREGWRPGDDPGGPDPRPVDLAAH